LKKLNYGFDEAGLLKEDQPYRKINRRTINITKKYPIGIREKM